MTTRLSMAPPDAKPLSWWAAIAFPGGLPYTDTPPETTSPRRRPPVRPLAPLVPGCFGERTRSVRYPQGPSLGGFLMTRLGPMWITPSLRIGSFKRGWGIYLTLGVGNMLTLDKTHQDADTISHLTLIRLSLRRSRRLQ